MYEFNCFMIHTYWYDFYTVYIGFKCIVIPVNDIFTVCWKCLHSCHNVKPVNAFQGDKTLLNSSITRWSLTWCRADTSGGSVPSARSKSPAESRASGRRTRSSWDFQNSLSPNSPPPAPLCQCRKQGTGRVDACTVFLFSPTRGEITFFHR